MNEENARMILSWRYDEPYDFYNPDSSNIEESVQEFLNPQNAYYSMTNSNNKLVAHCCFGAEARVSGGNLSGDRYSIEALDIGLGMRPSLTRRGLALRAINAILNFGRATFAPTLFRVTVAEFNQQALRVCEKAGFKGIKRFQREQDGNYFLILILEARKNYSTVQ